jgi:hypothetical protein
MAKPAPPTVSFLAKEIEGLKALIGKLNRELKMLKNRLDNAEIP